MQRQKPNWAVYVGGPADGQRYIIGLNVTSGTTTYTTPGSSPGMLKVHVYEVTSRFRKGTPFEAKARELVYLKTLEEEQPCSPPAVPYEQPMAAWMRPRSP